MSREQLIQQKLEIGFNLLRESDLIVLSSILNRAGNEDQDVDSLLDVLNFISESSFTRGQESMLMD